MSNSVGNEGPIASKELSGKSACRLHTCHVRIESFTDVTKGMLSILQRKKKSHTS